MKLTLAPLVSLLFGASYLVASATAYSYNDYNELDARYHIDDVLSERGFGLVEARESVDIPFQPSLRAFLEEAVAAYRRSMSEYQEDLEARASINDLLNPIDVEAAVFDGPLGSPPTKRVTMQKVSPTMTLELFKKEVGNKLGMNLDRYASGFLKENAQKSNFCKPTDPVGACAKDVGMVIFRKMIFVQAEILRAGTPNPDIVHMDVALDMTVKAYKANIAKYHPKLKLPSGFESWPVYLGDKKIADESTTLRQNGVGDKKVTQLVVKDPKFANSGKPGARR
ncbi:hypothetical protein D9611_005934 [Ephemerocybe angulata]|uniref:Uncharacterized protein n=1 Tax=Ephemerocybe angulata TaxID=980116 RepID=A0A8H5CFX0_9AGAR|nr:hypothetical protein D9611_005934 [Tulosesus angulatus]